MDGWKYGTCCLDIYLNKVSLVFDAVVSRTGIAVLLAVFPLRSGTETGSCNPVVSSPPPPEAFEIIEDREREPYGDNFTRRTAVPEAIIEDRL
jgi:hypothetical protein